MLVCMLIVLHIESFRVAACRTMEYCPMNWHVDVATSAIEVMNSQLILVPESPRERIEGEDVSFPNRDLA